MGTIEQNVKQWSSVEWAEGGDEWSECWGGTENLWHGTILPRIKAFVPTGRILEIAPGYGRCTQYLQVLCKDLAVVDVTEKCIKACQKRFESFSHIKYFVNDGKSLSMIEDDSLDFVISWDSLVHVEKDVISAYLEQLSLKLKPSGFGFIHHSNIGFYRNPITRRLSVKNKHWRAESMTAKLFRKFCKNFGLTCVSQEILAWGDVVLNDCFSLFKRAGHASRSEAVVWENPGFMREAENIKKISEIYNPFKKEKE
jgi:2-polyprenyl-3-methyl-5-hydroxy-6-metoxy-1,4-benzoquinol methylase